MLEYVIEEYNKYADMMSIDNRKDFNKCLKFAAHDFDRGDSETANLMLVMALKYLP